MDMQHSYVAYLTDGCLGWSYAMTIINNVAMNVPEDILG